MKISTVLKAGSLAFDIYNHQSAQKLGSLVRGGIERRSKANEAPNPPAQPLGKARSQQISPYRQQGQMATRVYQQFPVQHEQNPLVPIKKVMKHVTPDNLQKAMQWHGIIKSFIAKD